MNVVLEKLISTSSSDQTLEWPELIDEAKTNLMKIMVMFSFAANVNVQGFM